jgi:pimeloyl-ACP methyl ester carboxylesterase
MKPCLLLVPEFTEVEWRIRPQLEQWATVRSFDPPGIGAEPPAKRFSREAIIRRGLDELDDWGCERAFVVADGWGIPTAAGIAARRRELVAGMALGHAKLSIAAKEPTLPSTPRSNAANEPPHRDRRARRSSASPSPRSRAARSTRTTHRRRSHACRPRPWRKDGPR